MKVIVQEEWIADIVKLLVPEEALEITNRYRFGTGRGKTKLDISSWSDESLGKFHNFLGAKAVGDRSAKMSCTLVEQWMEIKKDPDGQIVGKLENLEGSLKQFIAHSPERYVFEHVEDGSFVPWFVHKIEYHEAREQCPASVEISLSGINTGYSSRNRNLRGGESGSIDGKGIHIRVEDIRQRTASQILERHSLYLSTSSRMESYEKEVKRYLDKCDVDGYQMSVSGKAKLIDGWYSKSFRSVGQAGRPAKMVIDPPDGERDLDAVHAPYWDKSEDKLWPVPIHPVYEMFDLEEHADYRVHVNLAEPYIYDDTVDQKLVLPKDVKDFLTVLIEHSKNTFEDIIVGKVGGTIVLIEGEPGVGKTLSAEVYSEKMHRPLYKVQSSQLGTTPEVVEEQLKEVLKRSERWGAILLIDEADVYIHERGEDIRQNAIVGVFLRVLEYYRGVLFMTTNRGTLTDDAIVSRTTARFMYEMPGPEDQIKLWTVMSEHNKVGLTKGEIEVIVRKLPNLSGRDIKNLLKLSMVMSANSGTRVIPETVFFVSKFKQSGRRG